MRSSRSTHCNSSDKEGNVAWLWGCESLIIGAQDEAFATRYYQKHVLELMSDTKI